MVSAEFLALPVSSVKDETLGQVTVEQLFVLLAAAKSVYGLLGVKIRLLPDVGSRREWRDGGGEAV